MQILDYSYDILKFKKGRIEKPIVCFCKTEIKKQISWLNKHWVGSPYYAVKANPAPHIILALYQNGIKNFDVASLHEVKLIRSLCPNASIALLHPVKTAKTIYDSFCTHHVRIFAVDDYTEFDKISSLIGGDREQTTLLLRIQYHCNGSLIPLNQKFGLTKGEAISLIPKIKKNGFKVGLSFHVGSQCVRKNNWIEAIDNCVDIAQNCNKKIDVLSIGGGIPVSYPHSPVTDLEATGKEIQKKISNSILKNSRLLCEPGRFLVASCESLITHIERKKNGFLYINDGVYGSFSDARFLNWSYPIRPIMQQTPNTENSNFTIYGPTCDSSDIVCQNILLPNNLASLDCLEFGMTGAYCSALSTRFNGFGEYDVIQTKNPFNTRKVCIPT